ncbi:hypothetical protein RF55_17527 [Lasius niger]|uniref:Double jelly roll-like domain-containing protein n=1 Tax=Lasius niger TaxID=67767 RepID=A0A0J7K2Q9_LASNI|nr:hypothetical protein RF55_17527 [Lasius niger]
MSFRSWDLYEFPLLHNTIKHSWTVKAASQLEKPRYVIFALQTGRKNAMSKEIAIFDNCQLTNVKLYLNSEVYSYDDMNLDFDKNRYALLFDMYSRFHKSDYGCDNDMVCHVWVTLFSLDFSDKRRNVLCFLKGNLLTLIIPQGRREQGLR